LFGGAGGDTISGNAGSDVAFGDNGQIAFTYATNGGSPSATDPALFLPAAITLLTTTVPTVGGDDIISAADGNNFVLGGLGGDQMTTGTGRDLILGDNGSMTFVSAVLTFAQTTDPALGGNDTIGAGDGDN